MKHQALMNHLEKDEVDIRHITALAADNTNITFEKHHSFYQLLNCPAHIALDTCKHACNQLSVDIESTVVKIYTSQYLLPKERNCVHFLKLLTMSGVIFCIHSCLHTTLL